MKSKYSNFNPLITIPTTSASEHGVTPHLNTSRYNLPVGTRYYIPLAIALMALVCQSTLEGKIGIFSSDSYSPCSTSSQGITNPCFTYEKFTSLTLCMVLSAFQNAGVERFPPNFLFRKASAELKEAFRDKPLVSHMPLATQADAYPLPDADGLPAPLSRLLGLFKTEADTTEADKTMPTSDEPNPSSDSSQSSPPVWKPFAPVTIRWPSESLAPIVQIVTTPFVVEAADRAPQNDSIIYGVGLTIGVENKYYSNDSVSALVLLERAFQMGAIPYNKRSECKPSDDEQFEVSNNIHGMLREVTEALLSVHNMSDDGKMLTFELKTAAQDNIKNDLALTRKLVVDYDRRRNFKTPEQTGHAAVPPNADVLVLASSSKNVIPEGVSITFLGKYELPEDKYGENLSEAIATSPDMDLLMALSKAVSARVVGWHYSLGEYLGASEDNEKADASTNPNQLELTAKIYGSSIALRQESPGKNTIKINTREKQKN